jgi:hypothetical protein
VSECNKITLFPVSGLCQQSIKEAKMSKRCELKRIVLFLTLFVSVGGLISCVPTPESAEVAEAGLRAWIDFPRDGARIPVGASVIVVSHAYAEDGVAEVLLSVNGTAYRRDPPAASGDTLVEVRQEWVPTEPGLYTLEVRAYDAAGEVSGSDAITVRVTGEAIELPTEVPPATGVPTGAPTATATPVPTDTPPPTATPVPTVAPTATPVPTLIPTDTPAPTFTPTPPPPDTTPPPVPTPAVPADELVLSCRSKQTLAWLPVNDPSGVVYYVKLERQKTATEWDSVHGWGPVDGKQVEADVDCGGIYRWAVRAQDGAGNQSAWSAYSNFSINLE